MLCVCRVVRGGITIGGAVCQPLKDDPMKCRFVYMMAIDPKVSG